MSPATLPASSPVPLSPGPGTSPTGIVLRRRARGRTAVPPRLTIVAGVTVAALIVQAGESAVLSPGGVTGLAVRVETGALPGLAVGMLLTATCVAAAARWAVRGDTHRARRLWTTLTVLIGYLTVAEATGLHSRIGRLLLDAAGTRLPRPLRHPDELRTLLYAVAFAGVALVLRREAARYRSLRPLLAASALAALAGTAVDVAVRTPTVLTTLAVRGLHDVAATTVTLAMIAGVVAARTLQAARGGRALPDRHLATGPAAALVLGLMMVMAPAFLIMAAPGARVPGLPALPPAGEWPHLAVAASALVGTAVLLLGARRCTRGVLEPEGEFTDFWTDRIAAGRLPRSR